MKYRYFIKDTMIDEVTEVDLFGFLKMLRVTGCGSDVLCYQLRRARSGEPIQYGCFHFWAEKKEAEG